MLKFVTATRSKLSSVLPTKHNQNPKLRATHIILITAILSLTLLYFFPTPLTWYDAYQHPSCGHIVLVSAHRHGSTWMTTNADGCKSNRSSRQLEVWNHESANLTLDQALDLVRTTSVKIFPDAFYNHALDVRTFLRYVKAEKVPVFVLRRPLTETWTSLQAAVKDTEWKAEHGGAGEREFKESLNREEYRTETAKFFREIKSVMRTIGLKWDDIEYESSTNEPWIHGPNYECYIRNCNF